MLGGERLSAQFHRVDWWYSEWRQGFLTIGRLLTYEPVHKCQSSVFWVAVKDGKDGSPSSL